MNYHIRRSNSYYSLRGNKSRRSRNSKIAKDTDSKVFPSTPITQPTQTNYTACSLGELRTLQCYLAWCHYSARVRHLVWKLVFEFGKKSKKSTENQIRLFVQATYTPKAQAAWLWGGWGGLECSYHAVLLRNVSFDVLDPNVCTSRRVARQRRRS